VFAFRGGVMESRGLAEARDAHAKALSERNQRLGLYAISIVVGVLGVSYASVPLYKVFCQVRMPVEPGSPRTRFK
jgi:hypothetical protein